MEIKVLRRQGKSLRAIAAEVGCAVATELEAEQASLLPLPPPWRGVIAPAQPRPEPTRAASPTRPLPAFPEQWTPQQHPLAVYAALVEAP